jgi:glycosyltransferase involved in cell wall biosynthesis
MSAPLVCCVCLTADRQRLTDRAVRSFLAQTYENRELLIFDSGIVPYDYTRAATASTRIVLVRVDPWPREALRVGGLRNDAIELARGADLIAHWDSDDWSHPERLFLQVEEMATNRATGFSNMLIYDSRGEGNAWEYSYQDCRRVLGTSLVYWRKTWEAHPFPENKIEGEETWWPDGDGVRGANGIFLASSFPVMAHRPLMIAEYHGANTGAYGKSATTPCIFDQTPAQRAVNPQFRRAPEWDQYCREVMK